MRCQITVCLFSLIAAAFPHCPAAFKADTDDLITDARAPDQAGSRPTSTKKEGSLAKEW